MNMNRIFLAAFATVLFGCVTINIYFPEAEAEQAADRIIDEVRGGDELSSRNLPLNTQALRPRYTAQLMSRVLDLLIPAAHAQANFDAASPASRAIEQSLKKRFPSIKPYLDSGAVGLTAAGLLEIRDRNAVPLKDRNKVRQLVTAQNTDWEALYKEIARVNGHPEWIKQIRQVFAKRWVAKAAGGWYHRDASGPGKRNSRSIPGLPARLVERSKKYPQLPTRGLPGGYFEVIESTLTEGYQGATLHSPTRY